MKTEAETQNEIEIHENANLGPINESFKLFLLFLDHTNEKKRTAFILREIFSAAAEESRNEVYKISLGECRILDLGCGEGQLAKEVISSLSDIGFKVVYEGVDPSAIAVEKAKQNLSQVRANSAVEANVQSTDFDQYFSQDENPLKKAKVDKFGFNFILASHSAYYAADKKLFVDQVVKKTSEDSLLCFIHAPQLSIHSVLRDKYSKLTPANTKEYYDVPNVLREAVENKDNDLRSITLPINSFVKFNTNLDSLKSKLKNKANDFTDEERKDKELLEFIFGKTAEQDLQQNLSDIDGVGDLINEVQNAFLGGENSIQIWAYVQIIGKADNQWFQAISKVLPKKLNELAYLSPLHWAAFEGRKDLYGEIKDLIEDIYSSQGIEHSAANIKKPGVITPLYMAILGAESSKEQEKYIELLKAIKRSANLYSKEMAFVLCQQSEHDNLRKLITKQDIGSQNVDSILMKNIKDFVGISASNIGFIDKKEANTLFLKYIDEGILQKWFQSKLDDELFINNLIMQKENALVVINLINDIVANHLYHDGNAKIAKPLLEKAMIIEQKLGAQILSSKGDNLISDRAAFVDATKSYLMQHPPTTDSYQWKVFSSYARTLYFVARSYFYEKYEESEKAAAIELTKEISENCLAISSKLELFEAALVEARVTGYLLMDERKYDEAFSLYEGLLKKDVNYIINGNPEEQRVHISGDRYFIADTNIRMFKCAKEQFLMNNDINKLIEALGYLVTAIDNTKHAVTNARQIARIYNDLGNLLVDIAAKDISVKSEVIENSEIKNFLFLTGDEKTLEIAKKAFEFALEVTGSFENDHTRNIAQEGITKIDDMEKSNIDRDVSSGDLPENIENMQDNTQVYKCVITYDNALLNSLQGLQLLSKATNHHGVDCANLLLELSVDQDNLGEILAAAYEVDDDKVLYTLMGIDAYEQESYIKKSDGSYSKMQIYIDKASGDVLQCKWLSEKEGANNNHILRLKSKEDTSVDGIKAKVELLINNILEWCDINQQTDWEVSWLTYLFDVQDNIELLESSNSFIPFPYKKDPDFNPDDFGGEDNGDHGNNDENKNDNFGLPGSNNNNNTNTEYEITM